MIKESICRNILHY